MGPMIERLHQLVDDFFAAAQRADPGAFACAVGCTACCKVDLSVFGVEAARVRTAFRALPDDVRAAAAARVRAGRHCAMIDPADGRCIVYEARPLICRSHGLAILIDGRVDHCPLNYRDSRPRRENILDLERVNEPLVAIEHAAGGRGERERLADLVLAEERPSEP